MPETFAEYRKRMLSYVGDRDPVALLERGPARVARLVRGLSARDAASRPGPKQWSVLEVLGHLADAELAFGWRVRNIVAKPGIPLAAWDENLWTERLDYGRKSVAEHLAMYRALRRANLTLVASVPRDRWAGCWGRHETRGRQTLRDFVVMEAAHDLAHERQIRRILG